MEKARVAISAGHYRQKDKDPKKTAGQYNQKYDLYEHDICETIVNSCYSRLGLSSYIEPYYIDPNPLWKKVKQIEDACCDMALEVHLNYYAGKNPERVTGIETIYEDGEAESRRLASLIQGQLVIDLRDRDRGLLSDNEVQKRRGWSQFYLFDKMNGFCKFIKNIPIITVLTEIGFLSNDVFAEKCNRLEIQPIAGNALADALNSFVKHIYTFTQGDTGAN